MADHFKTTFPSGQEVGGLNVRAYNPETDEWSIVWLDNRSPPDFEPMVGKFSNGIGVFDSKITTNDGRVLLVKFTVSGLDPLKTESPQKINYHKKEQRHHM